MGIAPVLQYIAKYVAKPEESSVSYRQYITDICKDMSPKESSKKILQKLLMRSIGERDISAQETNHLLLGLPQRSSSRAFVTVNAFPQEYNVINQVDQGAD
jgi:hypothetical protein